MVNWSCSKCSVSVPDRDTACHKCFSHGAKNVYSSNRLRRGVDQDLMFKNIWKRMYTNGSSTILEAYASNDVRNTMSSYWQSITDDWFLDEDME